MMKLLKETRQSDRSESFIFSPTMSRCSRSMSRCTRMFDSLKSYRCSFFENVCLRAEFNYFRAMLLIADATLNFWHTTRSIDRAYSGAIAFQDDLVGAMTCALFPLVVLDCAFRIYEGYEAQQGWYCFNLFVVFTYILEIVAYVSNVTPYSEFQSWVTFLSKARMLRLWQVVQVVPGLAHFQVFSVLGLMMRSLWTSLQTSVSCFMMLGSFLLVFSTLIVDGVIEHCIRTGTLHDASTLELRNAFGTVWSAMLTLFKSISGGDDWTVYFDALAVVPSFYSALFLLFMYYTVFTVLNIIIGTMVESILAASKSDREMMVRVEKENKKAFVQNMSRIFKSIDVDNSGEITLKQLESHMEDVDVCAYFAALGMDTSQVGRLFDILDDDDSGSVTREEFLKGALRLRGEAKSLDVAIILYELDALHDQFDELASVMMG
eukprot:TRINITY_DN12366_c0_g1_i4.p1 TRINITY_DN12366_c0_g1~~TRINITY_DN12366_c0_g1_i4.p1  ORF type:complete len:434 (-),score=53.72 TRINITY_DN12366_c0_g1_i4:322-1623(-)